MCVFLNVCMCVWVSLPMCTRMYVYASKNEACPVMSSSGVGVLPAGLDPQGEESTCSTVLIGWESSSVFVRQTSPSSCPSICAPLLWPLHPLGTGHLWTFCADATMPSAPVVGSAAQREEKVLDSTTRVDAEGTIPQTYPLVGTLPCVRAVVCGWTYLSCGYSAVSTTHGPPMRCCGGCRIPDPRTLRCVCHCRGIYRRYCGLSSKRSQNSSPCLCTTWRLGSCYCSS